MEEAGRPPAHGEFHRIWNYVLGEIPPEEDRWRCFNDFYINNLRAVDVQFANILQELDALNLSVTTIVVFTADHGEMSGSHGLRGTGPFV
jgi:arylsulfatase